MNQLFERLAGLDRAGRAPVGEWVPSVDVYECDGKLTVVVEVPWPGPRTSSASASATATWSCPASGARGGPPAAWRPSCAWSGRRDASTRTIPMDMALDVQQAEARLAGGVLTVTIPRLKDRRGRERVIPVQVEEES